MMDSVRPELEIFGVYDRGVPNQERIVLRVNQSVDLSLYSVFLGLRGPMDADLVFPIPDQFFWLGKGVVVAPSWIFLFTGSGKALVTQESHTKEPIQAFYWGKSQVALEHEDVVPALARWDYIEVGNKPNKSIGELSKVIDELSAHGASAQALIDALKRS